MLLYVDVCIHDFKFIFMIYFDQVSKSYSDGRVALDKVTISIAPKEFVSIVGHSGAGKTTPPKMLLAEENPTGGGVFLSHLISKILKSQN